MRKLLPYVAIIFIASIITHGCQQTSKPVHKATPPDTARTVVAYVYSANMNDFRLAEAVRFTKDTIAPDPTDKTRNILQRDTFYNILVVENVFDSTGRMLLAKNGQDSLQGNWRTATKNIVLEDYNFNYIPFIQQPKK